MATLARTQAVVVTDRRRPGPDLFLTAAMVALSGLGLLMVYTAPRPCSPCRATIPKVWCGVSSSSSGSAWSVSLSPR